MSEAYYKPGGKAQHPLHHPPVEFSSSSLLESSAPTSLIMFRPIVLAISVLSLLSFTHGMSLNTRQTEECRYVCHAEILSSIPLDLTVRSNEYLYCDYYRPSSEAVMCRYTHVRHIPPSRHRS